MHVTEVVNETQPGCTSVTVLVRFYSASDLKMNNTGELWLSTELMTYTAEYRYSWNKCTKRACCLYRILIEISAEQIMIKYIPRKLSLMR